MNCKGEQKAKNIRLELIASLETQMARCDEIFSPGDPQLFVDRYEFQALLASGAEPLMKNRGTGTGFKQTVEFKGRKYYAYFNQKWDYKTNWFKNES